MKSPLHSLFTNLGMVGMNVGLNTRVIDQIGWPNWLRTAASVARIGPTRTCSRTGPVAEGPWLKERPYVPQYLDEGWIREAAPRCSVRPPEAMLDSIRKPLGVRRFLSNVLHAADFTGTASTGCRSEPAALRTSGAAAGRPPTLAYRPPGRSWWKSSPAGFVR